MQDDAPIRADLARSGFYRLLALGFRYPEDGSLEEFTRVRDLFAAGDWPFPAVDAGLLPAEVPAAATLTDEYLRLFDRKCACSLYESEYGMGNKAFTKSRDLADISGFYKAFGMELAEETTDLYDHLAVELEFMSVLALKAAYARNEGLTEGLDVTVAAAKDFLQDHLGRWVSHFCDRLEETSAEPFYTALARLTRAFVASDCAELEVTPLPLARMMGGTPPAADDQDELVCPMAAGTPCST
jgi:DMSO reductase family type II enzyme chaperone